MPKKKSWFHKLRDYFVVTDNKQQQQGKRKKKRSSSSSRWVFRWMRTKRPPSLVAPTLSSPKEEQPPASVSTSSGLKVARRCNSTASNTSSTRSALAPQEEVVADYDTPGVAAAADFPPFKKNEIDEQDYHQVADHKKKESTRHPMGSQKRDEIQHIEDRDQEIQHIEDRDQEIQHIEDRDQAAATMIQTAFRGYLARKALRALKGLVRLQAIIRGRAVRRQAAATLKCLESIVNIQSQVCATRYQMAKINGQDSAAVAVGYSLASYSNSKDEQKVESVSNNRHRHRRDASLLTQEEENLVVDHKTEMAAAMIRRERMKAAYLFNGRHSAEYEREKAGQRLRNWVETYINEQNQQLPQTEEIKRVDTIGGKPRHHHRQQQPHLKLNIQQPPQCIHGPDTPALMNPRRSSLLLQKKQQQHRSTTFDHRSSPDPSSLAMPTYMAATESAKAKARLSPSPVRRQLRRAQSDACSDGDYSPYKWRISPVSSINSERTWSGTSVSGRKNNHNHIGCTQQQQNYTQFRSYYHQGCSPGRVDPGNSLRSSTGSSNSKDLGFDQFHTWALNWN